MFQWWVRIPRSQDSSLRKEQLMLNRETVHPLSNGEIFDFCASIMQQLPRDLDPSFVRHFLQNKKELGLALRALCGLVDIVRINRAVRTVYPKWVIGTLHPEFEVTGPEEYVLGSLEQWLHDDQKNGAVAGDRLYQYLKDTSMLEGCLGFSDLLAIQKLGLTTFQRHFSTRTVYGWKSVARRRDGDTVVPCLFQDDMEVKLSWYWLSDDWRGDAPALRFAG